MRWALESPWPSAYEYFSDRDRKEKPKQIIVMLNYKLLRQILDFEENNTAETVGKEYNIEGFTSNKVLQKSA